MVLQLATEAWNVAQASGIQLDPDLPAQTVNTARSVAPIIPSTLQDARSQRPMELSPIFGRPACIMVEFIHANGFEPGYLVMQAAAVGVQVPCITLMYDLLRQMNDAFVARQSWQVPDMVLPAVEQLLGREQIRAT